MNIAPPGNAADEKNPLRFSIGWLFKAVTSLSVIMMYSTVTGWAAIIAFVLSATVCLSFRSDPRSSFLSQIIFWFVVTVLSGLWGVILGSYLNFYLNYDSPSILIGACSISASIIAFALVNDFNRIDRASLATSLWRMFQFGIVGTLTGGAIYGVHYLVIGDHRLDILYHLSILLAIGTFAGVHIGLMIGSMHRTAKLQPNDSSQLPK